MVAAARTMQEADHPLGGSLSTTIQQIKDAGGEATAASVNISLPEDCERLIQETHDTYGPVDVLVNNAALTYYAPIKDYRVNRWMRSWAVNFHAPFLLSQLVLQDMITHESGSIVKHLFRVRHRPWKRAVSRCQPRRWHLLRVPEGRPGAVHPGAGRGSLPVWDIGDVCFAIPDSADSGNRVPQPGQRHGRSKGRGARTDG